MNDEVTFSAEYKAKKQTKKVPKGTSEYQAAWIVEDSDQDEEGAESDQVICIFCKTHLHKSRRHTSFFWRSPFLSFGRTNFLQQYLLNGCI